MAMTPDGTRIDDRQLDEALRTIATAPAPADLPARVLDAIAGESHGWWQPVWRPALVAVAVAGVALTGIVAWRMAPERPRPIVVSRMDRAPHPTTAPAVLADSSHLSALHEAPPRRATAPRTQTRQVQDAGLMPQELYESVPPLDPPEPLTIARMETPVLSEEQLHLNALHVPALDIKTLER